MKATLETTPEMRDGTLTTSASTCASSVVSRPRCVTYQPVPAAAASRAMVPMTTGALLGAAALAAGACPAGFCSTAIALEEVVMCVSLSGRC